MSNYFGHIPSSPMNLLPFATHRPKSEFGSSQKVESMWPLDPSIEFENREKYMETELTEEHYTSSDNIANQNEVPDDEPCPPPGLRRLVTGQTVSFDDNLNSPPFDRVIPGEGSTFTNVPGELLASSNENAVSDRCVSGSIVKGYNPIPEHIFGPTLPSKSEPHQFFFNNNNNNINDIVDSSNLDVSKVSSDNFFDSYLRTRNNPVERVSHPEQPVKSKPPQLFGTPMSQQQQQCASFSKLPVNSSTNPTMQNYQHRHQHSLLENVSREHENSQQRTAEDFSEVMTEADEASAIGSTNITAVANFQPVNNSSRALINIGMFDNDEKFSQSNRILNTCKTSPNRMVVEGSMSVYQSKMIPSSVSVSSPSYDYWYQNNNEFTSIADVKDVSGNEMTPNTLPLPALMHETSKHSKTPIRLLNTSSVSDMSDHQQIENNICEDSHQKHQVQYVGESNVPRVSGQAHDNLDKVETNSGQPVTLVQKVRLNEDSFLSNYNESVNRKSGNVLDESNTCPKNATPMNVNIGGKKTSAAKNPTTDNDESSVSRLDREPVPGALSAPKDDQKLFPFGYGYHDVNKLDNDNDEREETVRGSDSDDKRSVGQRVATSYPYHTIPMVRKNQSKIQSDMKSNSKLMLTVPTKPPLETRMVVGETNRRYASMKVPSGRGYSDERERDMDRERDYSNGEEKRDANRSEKSRRKMSRGRSRNESDEESYDVGLEHGSHSYSEKHRRDSPTRYRKSFQRLDCESSITQDDSFNEDEDDDRDAYRRYDTRKQSRNRSYNMPFYADPADRDWGYYDRPYWDRYSEDLYHKSSRPSSRSGSELRRDAVERGFKLPFYNFVEKPHSNTTFNEFQYWAKLRHTDPKGYMRWFRNTYPQEYSEWYYSRYMKQKPYQDDRRGSGHSGQSSINNDSTDVNEEKLMAIKDLSISRYTIDSAGPNSIHEHRSSPFKFKMPHVKGLFNPRGQLLVVNETYPKEGQPADIDVYEILAPDDDPDVVEFMNFTGPFVVGETHVNTVSEFVRYHAASASTSSEKLLYSLIDLVIRLRGVTDGIAISELLLSTYRDSQKLNVFSAKNDPSSQTYSKSSSVAVASLTESDVVEKYTNLLLQGNKNAALDWAINHKLWGHAFLLASKMGNKYYSNVLTKFDGSIPVNNPLKTLYQLYSNQIPQAATACADEKWGDWRPHLAMILSNPTVDSEVDKAAILTLGDSLYSKDIFASHFCYLAAEASFEVPSKPLAKLSLLSLRNGVDHFGVNTSNHAILLTQTYEFAKRLQRKEFTISALLPYKYLLAVRLVDFGKCDVALQYLESVAMGVLRNTDDSTTKDLASNVIELTERIMYSDPQPLVVDQSMNPSWLTSLRELVVSNEIRSRSSSDQTQLMVPRTIQSYQQSQLPLSAPTQEQQQELSSVAASQPIMFNPSLPLQQPESRLAPHNQTHPVSLPSLRPDQSSWEMNSPTVNSFEAIGFEQNQTAQKSLWNKESFGGDDIHDPSFSQIPSERRNLANDQLNDLCSPWDQQQQPTQISMHSTSNSFYDDGPSKSAAKTALNSVTATPNTTTMTTSIAVSKMNHVLRKKVQANVVNKQHYSIVKHYLRRWRTYDYPWLEREFSPNRINNVGRLTKNVFCNDELREPKIVFNGTFPIDRPLSVRRRFSTGRKTPSNTQTRTEETGRDSYSMSAAQEVEKNVRDRKYEKDNGGWLSNTFGKLMRPKNQMKLPDDKNPSIVWDESKKQWVDKNAENGNIVSKVKPPPKASDLQPLLGNVNDKNSVQSQPPTFKDGTITQTVMSNPSFGPQENSSLPGVSLCGTNNIYKLQKGRGMKANYVNVLSQRTNSPPSNIGTPPNMKLLMDSSAVPSVPPNINFFVPSSG